MKRPDYESHSDLAIFVLNRLKQDINSAKTLGIPDSLIEGLAKTFLESYKEPCIDLTERVHWLSPNIIGGDWR